MPWYLSPSGWPTHADTADEEWDLQDRGYAPIDEAQVQPAIDAFNAGAPAVPENVLTMAEAAAAIGDPGTPLGSAGRAASVALIAEKVAAQKYQAGWKYRAPATSVATGAPNLNSVYVTAFPIETAVRVHTLEIEVTTAAAGGTVRPLIYSGGINGTPAELLVDGGALDASTTGVKSVTLAEPVLLEPGIYWVGGVNQGTSSATVRRISGAVYQTSVSNGAAQTSMPHAWVMGSVTSAAPENFLLASQADSSTTAPYVALGLGWVTSAVNAAAPLDIETYVVGNEELVHPDVVDTVTGWNGYRYWMAATPFPNSEEADENPSIWASADGLTWVIPPGGANPVEPTTGDASFYQDVDLVITGGTAYLFFRKTGATGYTYVRTSTDGVTWTAKQVLFSFVPPATDPLSPAVVYDPAAPSAQRWQMWCVEAGSYPVTLPTLSRYTAPAATGPWSAATECVVPVPSGKKMWHVDVVLRDGTLHMLLLLNSPANDTLGSLHHYTSTDGLTWTLEDTPVVAGTPGWDNTIYRGTWQPRGDGWAVWYSARGTLGWRVGYTEIE